jgi:hypothetical protein
MQSESGIYGRSVSVNATRQAHELTESARGSVLEPGVKIAYALPDN